MTDRQKDKQTDMVKQYAPDLSMRGHKKLINPLPSDKTLDQSKLKAFADDKIKGTEKLKVVHGPVENIVGKGENAGYQHFLLYPQCFQKSCFLES